jgi:Skp family chaperone for outer membrane proteins
MKKFVVAVLLIVMLASASDAAQFTIRFGHAGPEGAFASIEGAFSHVFKNYVETFSGRQHNS